MSGHSKWATTKRKKATIDAKRAQIFTKLAKLITISARDGKSGDPNFNPSLRVAIDNARAMSMPKDNIDRAIKRGIGGDGDGARIEEITYEAYGPYGVGMLIEVLTDNRNRAVAEIKSILNKAGGSIAGAGSVAYQFNKVGEISIDEARSTLKGDDLAMAIIDAGAADYDFDDSLYVVRTELGDFHAVRQALETAGAAIESAELVQVAANPVELAPEKTAQIENLIESLESLEDVSAVFTNLA